MDFSKCCPWCEATFASKRTCHRHKSDKHSEEFRASLLKFSDPDEETFRRCISCNLWTLNKSHSIKKHESSALHKSRQIVSEKKRKSGASSSQQLSVSSSLSISEATLKKQKGLAEATHAPSVIAANIGKFLIKRFLLRYQYITKFIFPSQVPSTTKRNTKIEEKVRWSN